MKKLNGVPLILMAAMFWTRSEELAMYQHILHESLDKGLNEK